jgi:membrane protein
VTRRTDQLRTSVRRLGRFLGEGIWEEELRQHRGLQGFLLRELRILVVVVQRVPRGQIPLRAAAMTLATLLALVPSIVLTFTLVRAFGGFEGLDTQLQQFILQNLVAGVQEQASAFLRQFLEGVRSGAFQGISLLFLLGAVFGLLATIEDAFNQIWGIKRGRGLPNRLTTYTTIAFLGPFLVGLSLTMTASLQNAQILTRLEGLPPLGGLVRFLFGLLPLLVTVLGLTVLYVVMPNTRVSVLSALPSAAIAGILWEVSKWGYGLYLSSATMYRSLYGSLAAIPLLFLWIQLSWVFVLFGALLTFAREAADDFLLEEGAVTASFHHRLRAALRCMLAIARAHHLGRQPAPNVTELAAELHIPVRLVRSAVSDLLGGGLLHEVVRHPAKGEGGLVPAKDLQSLSVFDVIACLQNAGTEEPAETLTPDVHEVETILQEMDGRLADLAGPMVFQQILERVHPGEGRTSPLPHPVPLIKRP